MNKCMSLFEGLTLFLLFQLLITPFVYGSNNEVESCPRPDMASCNDPNLIPKCVAKSDFCDGKQHCNNCYDELNCTDSSFFFCDNLSKCIAFNTYSNNCANDRSRCSRFCDGAPHCDDESDEKTIGFGFKCESENNGEACVIPQYYLTKFVDNQNIALCTNDANKCFKIVNGINIIDPEICWSCLDGTIIQRKQVCNGVFDCPDLSDECLCFREKNSSSICEEFRSNSNCSVDEISCPKDGKCLDVSKLCDNSSDCSDGADEKYCSTKCKPTSNFQCSEDVPPDKTFSKNPVSCNGFPDCPGAEDECEANCDNEFVYCKHRRLDNLIVCGENDTNEAIDINLLCDNTKNCKNGFDEKHCPNLKQCGSNGTTAFYDTRPCGPDRCNLIATCPDNADELNCSSRTHFYCDNNTHFIPQWLRWDGIYDCQDYTDECMFNEGSVSTTQQLVKDPLRVFLWIFMIFSFIGNGAVIVKTTSELKYAFRRRSHSAMNRVGICNKIMILNLAFSDILMGVYLLIIVVKSIEFEGKYCERRLQWLQDDGCTFAGILAVVSSQSSIMLMVLMTSYRLYGVTNPFRAEKISGRMICAASLFIVVVAICLGIIPIVPQLRITFASSVNISQPYGPNIISLADFSTLFKNANALPGTNNSIPTPTNLTTRAFCSLFTNSKSVPSFCWGEQLNGVNNIAGYYGSDGVCLPRYYSSQVDPVSGYTLGIIILNFMAFLYMFLAYLYIYKSTSNLQQGDSDCGSTDDVRLKENKVMWSKILRLIVTDFICWVPICIMSFLSFGGINLPPLVYPITATILVPINSAANPWLYSSFLKDIMKDQWNSTCFKRFCLQRRIADVHVTDSTVISYTGGARRHRRFPSGRRRRSKSVERRYSMTMSSRVSVTGINTTDNGLTAGTHV